MSIRFAVIGVNHPHIHGQIAFALEGGGIFAGWHAPEPDLAAEFGAKYPDIPYANSADQLLDDPSIQLIVTAGIPADRAPLGIQAMRRGKDVMTDKPGATSLAQLAELRAVQQETGRIYSVCYSERFETRSTVRALELVKAGAIGQVVNTVGLGPHHAKLHTRPWWFFKQERFGGILCDIASHQCDQFLAFTGATEAEIVTSAVANRHHPQHPELEDFGECLLSADNGASGYFRVDWLTPDGLGTWGDGRLIILGTQGYIELRKYADIATDHGPDQLFLVDGKGEHRISCAGQVGYPFFGQLILDCLNRSENAMTQAHTFKAAELCLLAQEMADRQSAHGVAG
jgi:predicted dehydrogenase